MTEFLKLALDQNESTVWNDWWKNTKIPIIIDKFNFGEHGNKIKRGYIFVGVEFRNCIFNNTEFHKCEFDEAIFVGEIQSACFEDCSFKKSRFNDVIIKSVDFPYSSFNSAEFINCTSIKLNLYCTSLVDCNFEGGSLCDSKVFGVNVWNINFNGTEQNNLIVKTNYTPNDTSKVITVSDLEVANFINLLLNSSKVSKVIDTMTSKVVLILGRFTKERMTVLEKISSELRSMDYTPIIFNFDGPKNTDTTGTIAILAKMASFIIADITDGQSVLFELGFIFPQLYTTPLILVKLEGSEAFSMHTGLNNSIGYVGLFNYNENSIGVTVQTIIDEVKTKMADIKKRLVL